MKNEMVNELIGVMRERIPKGSNLANSLMEILCMGKEAIYRRLRGEVAFTFEEVSLISQHLGISLDKIVGRRMLNDTMFDLNLLHTGTRSRAITKSWCVTRNCSTCCATIRRRAWRRLRT